MAEILPFFEKGVGTIVIILNCGLQKIRMNMNIRISKFLGVTEIVLRL